MDFRELDITHHIKTDIKKSLKYRTRIKQIKVISDS